MSTMTLLEYALFLQAFCASVVLAVLIRKRLVRKFSYLAAFAGVRAADIISRVALLFFRKQLGFDLQTNYNCYFYSYWVFAFIERVLLLFVIYQIFLKVMSPFRGLSRLGTMLFRWVCGVALVVSFGMATITGPIGSEGIRAVAVQFQQGLSILTVCLLLFVCFSIQHLGLNYRSHVFGASLGLGIMGTMSLVQAAWEATHDVIPSVYSMSSVIEALGAVATLSVWGFYFARPEPKQEMVLLPTTSPYFHWNQIAAALGNNPGYVAVAGFTPDSLSLAERQALQASAKHGELGGGVGSAEPAVATGTQF